MLFLDGLDYGLTRAVVSSGAGVELNPFLAPIIFTWRFAVTKLILFPLAAIGSSLYLKSRQQRRYFVIVLGVVLELVTVILVSAFGLFAQ